MKMSIAVPRRSASPDFEALGALARATVRLTGAAAVVACGEVTLDCRPAELRRALARLRVFGFEQLLDVDLRPADQGVLLVHHLLSVSRRSRLRVRTRVEGPCVPGAADIYPSAAGRQHRALSAWARESGRPARGSGTS